MTTESKFKNVDVVAERIRPALKLMIQRYVDRIYYCQVLESPVTRELVYTERELMVIRLGGHHFKIRWQRHLSIK